MRKLKKELYESPFTRRTLVEVEASMCAGSDISIEKDPKAGNVEVDDYASVENDVTFE